MKDQLFTELDKDFTAVDFVNQIENTDAFNIFNYRNFYNGGGVAVGDINNDGLVDLFFTANMSSNKLYLNKGNLEFEDISEKAGIDLTDKWSTGVTMIDINADGFLDIYVCNAGYREGSDQKNALFINQGDLSFVEQAAQYNLDLNDYTTQANFFDYDQDGDLDVYMLNNSFIPVNTLNYNNKRELRAEDWPVADFLRGGGDKLLENVDGVFKDVSEDAGIFGSLIGFGLGSTVGDINNDGLLDIYVSNDFFERDYLYLNKGDGTFSEELESRIKHLSHSSMGADMADINNDGFSEIFVTDMLPDDDYRLKTTSTFDNINLRKLKESKGFYNQFMHNSLQLNDQAGKFKEISFYADVAASDWSWGALFFDADNDSYNDIFVCNGILNDVIDQDFIDFFANDVIQEMVLSGDKVQIDSIIGNMPSNPIPNKFFRNNGALGFTDIPEVSGFTKETFSNGAAYADFDNDGDFDLAINNVNQVAQIYKNNSSANYLGFNLEYQKPNAYGIGSKVFVYQDDQVLAKELIVSRGFQSSVDYKLIFGLGEAMSYDSIVVQWPKGELQKLENLEINQTHSVVFDAAKTDLITKGQKNGSAYFTESKIALPKHEEDDFVDFYYERNIPLQLSKEGPCLAKGDFNNDGLEDIYIGGGTDQPPKLLRQTASGFVEHQTTYFEKFKAFEDTYAVFFDADGDQDLDLYVGSGGNNVTYNPRAFRDRLYLNQNGSFEIDYNAIPPITLNTSIAIPLDLQGDGDLDLVVGMRSVPGEYGVSPGSYVYLNNGSGRFREVTKQAALDLTYAGNITDAIVADVLDVPGEELILVGEWMSPKILSFKNDEGASVIESELSAYSGWWQSVKASDIDNDGDLDLILGNIGENFYLKASLEEPMFLWINDFDDNGSLEKIITKRQANGDIPVYVKRDMVDQIPMLKKENLRHSEYARKSMGELFSKEKIASSTIKQVNYLSSAIAYNEGGGHFRVKKMDREMQLSSVNAILEIDLNKDGFKDFVLGGNNTFLLPQFSALDACVGKIMLNQAGKGFEIISGPKSGLNVEGVVREIHQISVGGDEHVLFMVNDKVPKVYKVN